MLTLTPHSDAGWHQAWPRALSEKFDHVVHNRVNEIAMF